MYYVDNLICVRLMYIIMCSNGEPNLTELYTFALLEALS